MYPKSQHNTVVLGLSFYLLPSRTKMSNRKISNEEWFNISFLLEQHHAVFYKLWEMGKPCFVRELHGQPLETACVQFDRHGEFVWFFFNPDFWDSLDMNNKLFVICHEALHIILNHGIRICDKNKKDEDGKIIIDNGRVNACLDIVVNHSLVNNFGFRRTEIQREQNFCWIDTVFKGNNPLPSDNECFEFYYNLHKKTYGDGKCFYITVDDHSGLQNSESADKLIENLNENLSQEEKQALKDMIEKHFEEEEENKTKKAGKGTGAWTFANSKVVRKKKWETVIKKWASQYWIYKDVEIEQWGMDSRRSTLLNSKLFLPSDYEDEAITKGEWKIDVWFFLDTSGSCWGLKDRFFSAALSLDPSRFNVRLFCFDTKVEETTLESRKVYGGGGTSFTIMEERIQLEKKTNPEFEYPEAVFVMTDGYGDKIKNEKPEAWYWFLSEGGSKDCIDSRSNIYWLKDYE